jgi:probable F420-dependent oxidoreductase
MKVSLGLPTHRVDTGEEFVSGAAIVELSQAAEAAGFDAVFVTDHPAPSTEWLKGGGHHTLDPFVALGFAAAVTSTLRLQTNLFVAAYRHPLLGAKLVASLDALSGGRVILGVGAGYLEAEFEAVGADFANRNDVLDETIATMRRAWTGEDTDGVTSLPRPAQLPGPPVWIGGNSKRAIRRVVEMGQGWVPMPSPKHAAETLHTPGMESVEDLRARITIMTDLAAEAGRTEPIDIAYMPSGLDMFARASPEPASVLDEIQVLADMGVTWATVTLPGKKRADLLREIDRFGAEIIAKM